MLVEAAATESVDVGKDSNFLGTTDWGAEGIPIATPQTATNLFVYQFHW